MLRILLLLVVMPSVLWSQESAEEEDVWEPLKFLVGSWEGEVTGTSGVGKGRREFSIVVNGKFIHIENEVVFEPRPDNPMGEVMQDWGLMSWLEESEILVLRQFSSEGFVSRYVVDTLATDTNTIVYVSETIENAPAGTRARLTITIQGTEEFTEIYERAPPGEDFQERIESHWIRKK